MYEILINKITTIINKEKDIMTKFFDGIKNSITDYSTNMFVIRLREVITQSYKNCIYILKKHKSKIIIIISITLMGYFIVVNTNEMSKINIEIFKKIQLDLTFYKAVGTKIITGIKYLKTITGVSLNVLLIIVISNLVLLITISIKYKQEIKEKTKKIKLYINIWGFNNNGKIIMIAYMLPVVFRCMICWTAIPGTIEHSEIFVKPVMEYIKRDFTTYNKMFIEEQLDNAIKLKNQINHMIISEAPPSKINATFNEHKKVFFGIPAQMRDPILANIRENFQKIPAVKGISLGTGLSDGSFSNNKINEVRLGTSKANSNLSLTGGSFSGPYVNYMFNTHLAIFCTPETIAAEIYKRSTGEIQFRFTTQSAFFWTDMHLECSNPETGKKTIPSKDYLKKTLMPESFLAMLLQDGGIKHPFSKDPKTILHYNDYPLDACTRLQEVFDEDYNIKSEIITIYNRSIPAYNIKIMHTEALQDVIASVEKPPRDIFGYKTTLLPKIPFASKYNEQEQRWICVSAVSDIEIDHLKNTAKTSQKSIIEQADKLKKHILGLNEVVSQVSDIDEKKTLNKVILRQKSKLQNYDLLALKFETQKLIDQQEHQTWIAKLNENEKLSNQIKNYKLKTVNKK